MMRPCKLKCRQNILETTALIGTNIFLFCFFIACLSRKTLIIVT